MTEDAAAPGTAQWAWPQALEVFEAEVAPIASTLCHPPGGYSNHSVSAGGVTGLAERGSGCKVLPDERIIWETLLKQAEANRAIANAILSQTQRMVREEDLATMEPDRLDAWYAAANDAADGATIAGMIAEQANSCCPEVQLEPERFVEAASTADGTARYTSEEGSRCALGTKRVVPSVLDLLNASRMTHEPVPKAISFAQDAAEASPALAVGPVDADATRLLLEPDANQLASDACRSSEHQRRDNDLAQGFGVGLLGRPPEREVVESDDVGAVYARIDKGRGLDNAPVGSATAPCDEGCDDGIEASSGLSIPSTISRF